MGGKVGADSTPGRGSVFWFEVSLAARQTAPAPAPLAPPPIDAEARIRERFSGRRVLLVDDEPINLEVARFLLSETGLLVDTAENGLEAVHLAGQHEYALVLMDVQMPKLDGLQATRQLRAQPSTRYLTILAMTANAFAEDKARCLEAGMDDYLIKPFDPDHLFATLLDWLERTQAAADERK